MSLYTPPPGTGGGGGTQNVDIVGNDAALSLESTQDNVLAVLGNIRAEAATEATLETLATEATLQQVDSDIQALGVAMAGLNQETTQQNVQTLLGDIAAGQTWLNQESTQGDVLTGVNNTVSALSGLEAGLASSQSSILSAITSAANPTTGTNCVTVTGATSAALAAALQTRLRLFNGGQAIINITISLEIGGLSWVAIITYQ